MFSRITGTIAEFGESSWPESHPGVSRRLCGGAGIVRYGGQSLAPREGRFLAPWVRSATPGFARGGNKFDLDRWDPAYFQRLHEFFEEADRRGIVVEAVLFFIGPGYDFSPLNPKNNVNGTTLIDGKRYLSLDNGNVLAPPGSLLPQTGP